MGGKREEEREVRRGGGEKGSGSSELPSYFHMHREVLHPHLSHTPIIKTQVLVKVTEEDTGMCADRVTHHPPHL